jgi:hypothetical protein
VSRWPIPLAPSTVQRRPSKRFAQRISDLRLVLLTHMLACSSSSPWSLTAATTFVAAVRVDADQHLHLVVSLFARRTIDMWGGRPNFERCIPLLSRCAASDAGGSQAAGKSTALSTRWQENSGRFQPAALQLLRLRASKPPGAIKQVGELQTEL